jgi:hypothetical protein
VFSSPRAISFDVPQTFSLFPGQYKRAQTSRLLDQRIQEAEELILGRYFVAVTPQVFGDRAADLAGLGFQHRLGEDRYVAEATPELRELLRTRGVPFEPRSVLDPRHADPEKLAQLEAVRRWFTEDWRRIEPKLRTSIVEGISVFLSCSTTAPK